MDAARRRVDRSGLGTPLVVALGRVAGTARPLDTALVARPARPLDTARALALDTALVVAPARRMVAAPAQRTVVAPARHMVVGSHTFADTDTDLRI